MQATPCIWIPFAHPTKVGPALTDGLHSMWKVWKILVGIVLVQNAPRRIVHRIRSILSRFRHVWSKFGNILGPRGLETRRLPKRSLSDSSNIRRRRSQLLILLHYPFLLTVKYHCPRDQQHYTGRGKTSAEGQGSARYAHSFRWPGAQDAEVVTPRDCCPSTPVSTAICR
jgi:hypothetical protein